MTLLLDMIRGTLTSKLIAILAFVVHSGRRWMLLYPQTDDTTLPIQDTIVSPVSMVSRTRTARLLPEQVALAGRWSDIATPFQGTRS